MLVMAGLLGIGLSVANQSTQDIADSGNESESVRVFNAAEAEVESVLANPDNFTATAIPLTGATDGLNGALTRHSVTPQTSLKTYLPAGGVATIDLPSGYGSTVTLNWDSAAALMIAVYYEDAGTIKVRYEGVTANGATTIGGFAAASGSPTASIHTFNPTSDVRMIRIKSLLTGTNLSVPNSFSDPQYHLVRSEATGTDGVSRAIEIAKMIEVPPAILDYAVYSGESIIKP